MVKYCVRKNNISYANGCYHKGKATQVIGLFDNFGDATNCKLEHLKVAINYIFKYGNGIEKMTESQNLGLLAYSNILNNTESINSVLNPASQNRDLYSKVNRSITLNNLNQVKILDELYPTQSVEIIPITENYLLAPRWNKEFFSQINIEISSPKIVFDESQVTDRFITKGLFIHELDFWINLTNDIDALDIAIRMYDFSSCYDELISKSPILQKHLHKTEDKVILQNRTGESLWMINSNLNTPPILFDKIDLCEIDDHQVNIYKDLVIEYYLANRFLSDSYSHESMMTANFPDYWGQLAITKELAIDIINSNKQEIDDRAEIIIDERKRR